MKQLSIVIPAFNREKLIIRALESIFEQNNHDVEVIVVDDASEDSTVDVVKKYADKKNSLSLVIHDKNSGVCKARNTGVDNAKGEWICFLDSDDYFLPEGISTIMKYINSVNSDSSISRLGFCFKNDLGGFYPEPPPEEGMQTYEEYLQWLNNLNGSSDMFYVARTSTFDKVRWPENRAFELLYHLDFAIKFITQIVPEPVAMMCSDAGYRERQAYRGNRISIEKAYDNAIMLDEVFSRHGESMWKYARQKFADEHRSQIKYYYWAGQYCLMIKAGLSYMICIINDPRVLIRWCFRKVKAR